MPINDDERNAHPVERQTKATDIMSVCGFHAIVGGEARAHRGVGYKNSVSRFHMLTMSRCDELRSGLINRTYRPQKGEKHEVFEPKHRVTTSSKYPDRVVQASFIVNYFYPHVIPYLIKNNFACIKGRGVDAAREALKKMLREASPDDWCVKADMTDYFGSIDHGMLYQEVGCHMVDDWAAWFYWITVENSSTPIGLDLGSEVYQLSAAAFLNRLDHILEAMGEYARYQDDLIFIGPKDKCFEALNVIYAEADRLHLTVSKKKTYMQPVKRPIKFLGFSFLRHPTGRVTMKRLPEKLRHEKLKLKRMAAKGVPMDRVESHWRGARECIKKGSRSDLHKMDRYYKSLFGGRENGNNQEGQEGTGNPAEEAGRHSNQS